MTHIEAQAHAERILETSADAIAWLVGRGLEEGRIKLIRTPGAEPSIDWEQAAAYLEEQPEFTETTAATEEALLTLQRDFEATEMAH